MLTLPLEVGKVYRNGSGRTVKVLFIEDDTSPSFFKVLGISVLSDGTGSTHWYHINGQYTGTAYPEDDLIEDHDGPLEPFIEPEPPVTAQDLIQPEADFPEPEPEPEWNPFQ